MVCEATIFLSKTRYTRLSVLLGTKFLLLVLHVQDRPIHKHSYDINNEQYHYAVYIRCWL